MGVIYYVACKDCKVRRDLDKFYLPCWPCGSRAEALESAEQIKTGGYAYRAMLLVGFLSEHHGHNIVFYNEHDEIDDVTDPYCGSDPYAADDRDFWKSDG